MLRLEKNDCIGNRASCPSQLRCWPAVHSFSHESEARGYVGKLTRLRVSVRSLGSCLGLSYPPRLAFTPEKGCKHKEKKKTTESNPETHTHTHRKKNRRHRALVKHAGETVIRADTPSRRLALGATVGPSSRPIKLALTVMNDRTAPEPGFAPSVCLQASPTVTQARLKPAVQRW